MFNKIKNWNKKGFKMTLTTIIVITITLVMAILIFIAKNIWTTLLK